MNIIIRELWADHQNMARLLKYMRYVLGSVEQGGADDQIGLIRKAVEYMATYLDTIHHPKEDTLFDLLVRRDASAGSSLNKLQNEHRLLARKIQKLREMFGLLENGSKVPLDTLSSTAADYTREKFQHMRFEEEAVFPLIEQNLTISDWKKVISNAPTGKDPLFGIKRSGYYHDLHDQLFRFSHSDVQ